MRCKSCAVLLHALPSLLLATSISLSPGVDLIANGPPDLGELLQSQQTLTTFTSLLLKYPDLLIQLPNQDGVTLIAPSDDAFNNIPGTSLNGIWDTTNNRTTESILRYHILPGVLAVGAISPGPTIIRSSILVDPTWTNVTSGQNVLVNKQPSGDVVFESGNGARCSLVTSDLVFTGGILQIVDNLLLPPTRIERTAQIFNFEAFLGLLYAGNQMPFAAESPNVTIFIPVDKAMQLVAAPLQGLDLIDLIRVAAYHIVPNQVLSSISLKNGTTLPTAAQGPGNNATLSVTIRQAGNNLFVNSAPVVQPDILIANGIIHLIGNVLNPAAPSVVPNANLVSQAAVFAATTRPATTLPFTTAVPCTANCPVMTTSSSMANFTASSSSVSTRTSKGAAATLVSQPNQLLLRAAMGIAGVGVGFAAIG